MKRHFIPFSSSWRMPIDIRVSRGVVGEGSLFICGQCDLDAEGRPQRPGDLSAQSEVALDHLLDVVRQAGLKARDLAHLHVFYRCDGSVDERGYEAALAEALPAEARPTTVLTPVPDFFYPGVEVEIDAIACTGNDGDAPASNKGSFPPATRRTPDTPGSRTRRGRRPRAPRARRPGCRMPPSAPAKWRGSS